MAGRGQAPGIISRPADKQVHRQTRHGHALRFDSRPAEVELHHDLWIVVAELRTHDGEVGAVDGLRPIHNQEVRCAPDDGRGGSGNQCGIVVAGERQRGDRLLWVERDNGSRVDHGGARDIAAGQGAVIEVLVECRWRFRIVKQHCILPCRLSLVLAQPLFQGCQELRVDVFCAATGTEDRADEGSHGDHVVDIERPPLRFATIHSPVGISAVCIGLRVCDDLATLIAIGGDEEIDLVCHQLLGLETGYERPTADHQRKRVDTRHVRHCGPRRTTP